MNYDEFAFFNRQLAAMLRDGIPLEGALKQLCAGMKAGPLRFEMERLDEDLARGVPLKEALARRQLPKLYLSMFDIGARSNDLPGVLTLIADHYQRANTLWNRLKGLMVYPLIVTLVSLGLTTLLSVIFGHFLARFFAQEQIPNMMIVSMWAPPVLLAAVVILGLVAVSTRSWRARLRWRLPAFREASLSQLASAMALMLRNGITLPEALLLAETLEAGSPASVALGEWRRRVEAGEGKPEQWPDSIPPFPPMYLWLVRKGGEDPGAGFQKAAEVYHTRASYRIELALYGALPVSILLLGLMVFWQVAPLFRGLTVLMNSLGGWSG